MGHTNQELKAILVHRQAAWATMVQSHPFAARVVSWGMETIRLALACGSDGSATDEEVAKVWQGIIAAAQIMSEKQAVVPEPGLTINDFVNIYCAVTSWCYGSLKKMQDQRLANLVSDPGQSPAGSIASAAGGPQST